MNRSRKILTSEDALAFAQAMKDVDLIRDAEARRALGETIIKDLRNVIEKDDIIAALRPDTLTFLPGQSVEFNTKKGVKAYVHEPGSYAPRSTVALKKVTLATEMVSVHPEMEIGQLQSGRYGSLQDIKNMALSELLGRKYGYIWTTLIGSIATTDSNYWATPSAATAAQKKTALQSGFDYVIDRQDNDVVAILGRTNALTFLSDASIYSGDKTQENAENTKLVQFYRGVPVITLKQYTDGWGTNVIDESEIIILGTDTLKLGYDRQLDFLDEIEVNTLMWHMHIFESYGLAVVEPTKNARIHIT